MAKKRALRALRGGKGSPGIEWVGGIVVLPAYVTGEGDPYRPEALLWLSPDGLILGTTLAMPGEAPAIACESLQETIEQPMCGPPHAPTRVRVASPALAEALHAGHSSIDVVVGPTPELDAVAAAMNASLLERADDDEESSYYLSQLEPDACASFFRAAAGLYRAAPWKVVPSDQDLLALDTEALGIRDGVVVVIGQMEQNRGVILFEGWEDFEAFLEVAAAVDPADRPKMPPHLDLNFESPEGVPDALVREVRESDWEVADAGAIPWLVAVDEDLVPRPPTPREVTIGEALSRALPVVLAEKDEMLDAWEGGPPVSRTLSVHTHAGEIDVTLRVPCGPANMPMISAAGVLADLFALEQGEGWLDSEARGPLEEELLRQFSASPEAEGLSDLYACRSVMDYAASYFGVTIAMLDPTELEEIVFEIIPRQVSIDASEARSVIEVNRAFYAFLKRAFGLVQADACLDVLGEGAVKELEAELSDPRNFGPAKTALMAGREAGFDMDTKEGLEAWMEQIQGKPLPTLQGGPALGGPLPFGPPSEARSATGTPKQAKSTKSTKKAKGKRKAARKARKRNR